MVTQEEQMIEDLKEAKVYKKPVLAGEALRKGFQKGIKSYKIPVRERRESAIARKAISLIAPSGSLVRAITQVKKKKGDRGRGRPRGTYKARYLPSGRVVKVPTHVYKKMLSAEKAQYRLAMAERQGAMQAEAEQLAMQQDPRFQQSGEGFLESPDMQHEEALQRAQEQAQMAQQMAQQQAQIDMLVEQSKAKLNDAKAEETSAKALKAVKEAEQTELQTELLLDTPPENTGVVI